MNRGFSIASLALAGALTLSQIACGSAPNDGSVEDTSAASSAAPSTYDGETIFRAVFFGTGPAATLLPEVWGTHAKGGPAPASVNKQAAIDSLRSASASFAHQGNSQAAADLTKAANDVAATRGATPAPTMSAADHATLQDAVVAAIRASNPAYFEKFAAEMHSHSHPRVQRALEQAAAEVIHFTANPSENGMKVSVVVWYQVAIVVFAVAVLLVFIEIKNPGGSGKSLENDTIVNNLTLRLAPATTAGSSTK